MSVIDRVAFPLLSFMDDKTFKKIMKLGNVDDVHIYQEKNDDRVVFCVHIITGDKKIYKKFKQIVEDEHIKNYL